ncbi:MAG: DUF296 domain-containing protein [Candidatus Micrarchaeia archaeon]
MESRKLKTGRLIAVRFEPGEELVEGLARACAVHGIRSGAVWGIGALKEAELITAASTERLNPKTETIRGPVELAAHGNVSLKEGKPFVHLHAALSLLADNDKRQRRGARTLATHISRGVVSLTGEFFILETGEIRRRLDEKIKMFVWKL